MRMAKPLIVENDGKQSSFNISKLDRSKLYPTRKRLPLDSIDGCCVKAALTTDGSQVLKSGMTSQGYFTTQGRWVPKDELVGVAPDGQVVELKPSTLGVPQALDGPVSFQQLLDLEVTAVYCLEALEANDALINSLKAGDIYSCSFNYGADYNLERAFVLSNDEGLFAIVGNSFAPEWIVEGMTFAANLYDEVVEDDLDFEMM